ncbi:glycosyltransferase family 2 protein [Chitinophaga qingshengii]|uniref:Glycosyltransferase n=1 Tax=Chitinophaga qingshengii TaxID=1569794 RepID=A0ABR7TFY3_9BACT|nr:glycosyltransferase [Chitinophaga qingshengii]MBC9929254.1 glycosyltransferase [Chitinophaga qingshengii]
MKNKLVSVVMPCYNMERYISMAIDSVLSQSYQELELIIINDGSSDNTGNIIRTYDDSRIKYVSLPANKGNYPARNIGMRMATGKYIAVMDADDISESDRLMTQVRYLDRHLNTGCIGTQGTYIDENNAKIGWINYPGATSAEMAVYFLINNYTIHPSLMFRRSAILKHDLFYNEKYRYAADFALVSSCISRFQVLNIGERLMQYRVHPNQISSAKHKEQVKYADMIRLTQLERLQIRLTPVEQKVYLKLLKGDAASFSRREVARCVTVCRHIVDHNDNFGIYDKKLLRKLFSEHVLSLL